MKRAVIGLAAAAAVAALPAAAGADGGAHAAAKHAKCHGTAQRSELGVELGLKNAVDADFVCNRAVKSFVVKLNKKLSSAGTANGSYANNCKKKTAKSYKCTGSAAKGEHIQTSFSTKASNACSGKKLKVKVTAAKRTFRLRGPC
jgi:hypothetical protein